MTKPINEFGGWLAFFNISLWLQFIIIILMSITLAFSLFKVSNPTIELGLSVTLIRYIITGFLFFKMIQLVKQKEAVIPDKIIQVLIWYVVVALVFVAFVWAFSSFSNISILIKLRMSFFKYGFSVIVFSLIWGQYFRVSKRVLAVFGKNAGVK